MKFFLQEDVLTAARRRVRWVYQEFEHVYVCCSGGKDSTVVVNLALEAAAEMGRLPIRVFFMDQEAEWMNVIYYMRQVMGDPRVKPFWLQIPFKMTNATSAAHPFLHCWEPGATWLREKEACSIKRNVYGVDRFAKLFPAFLRYHHFTKPAAYLAGVRCEESPARMLGLTTSETYKGETWGVIEDARRKHFGFYPIYDWSYRDVWKAIHDHGWPYCKIYDYMYQYGLSVREMRVSNLHHETALRSLFYLQEIEPDTWERITARLNGANTAGHLAQDFYGSGSVPPMFKDKREYRDYLLEHLIQPDKHALFRSMFASYDARFEGAVADQLLTAEIQAVLVNDVDGTILGNFGSNHFMDSKNLGKRTVGGAY